MRSKIALGLSILFSIISLQNSFAQEDFDHVQGEVLIRINKNHSLEWVIKDLELYKGLNTQMQVRELLSDHMNIWRFTFNKDIISHSTMLEMARKLPSVHSAQLNYIMKKRAVPNDTQYGQQWQYEQPSDIDLDAEAAWDITTGGVTALGDTIVVCVIDDGLEISHPDWGDNIWHNYAEINGTPGVDDDGNGYIDDFRGWNADNNNNNIVAAGPFTTHGTAVSGIVAAKGNNGIGVSGVCWNVKLMFVVGGGNSAQAISAYSYPLESRKLYNQTNGALGAFVVSTNASWGVDNQQCATFAPLMNDLYDTLGTYGVLNAAATANANTDVDVQGDFPTSCASDYLIAVTNINQSGLKVSAAAYGSTHIDLGAFGAGTHTVSAGGTYGGFGGTSGATPHVASTIGLLYSAPCPRLALLARTQPAQTALRIKQIILNSTVANTSIAGITVSGGVLNMKNALDSVMAIGCSLSGCHEPYNISAYNTLGTSSDLNWDGVDSTAIYYLKYRETGTSTWMTSSSPDTFTTISGLIACTNYEAQIASSCDSSVYSTTYSFKTGDCCNAPSIVNIDATSQTSASFSWAMDPFVTVYTLEYKLQSGATWSSVTTTTPSVMVSGLDSCEYYELRILSSCAVNVNNLYSPIVPFETDGCGKCTSDNYCASSGQNSSDDWLENVTLGSINNTTGDDGGYISFVNGGQSTDIMQGGSYPISVEIGFNTGPWATNWQIKVWIDYNQDEILDDATEVAFTAGTSATTTIHNGTINIPATAMLSRTRMRVAMVWSASAPTPCGSPTYGEIEDYCINVVIPSDANPIEEDIRNTELNVYPNPFNNHLMVGLNSPASQEAIIVLRTIAGQEIINLTTDLEEGDNTVRLPSNSLPQGMYLVSVHLGDGTILTKKVIRQ
jgi:serine protease